MLAQICSTDQIPALICKTVISEIIPSLLCLCQARLAKTTNKANSQAILSSHCPGAKWWHHQKKEQECGHDLPPSAGVGGWSEGAVGVGGGCNSHGRLDYSPTQMRAMPVPCAILSSGHRLLNNTLPKLAAMSGLFQRDRMTSMGLPHPHTLPHFPSPPQFHMATKEMEKMTSLCLLSFSLARHFKGTRRPAMKNLIWWPNGQISPVNLSLCPHRREWAYFKGRVTTRSMASILMLASHWD